MTVVDASVALKWLLEEPLGKSQETLERHINGRESLVAPELLNYEVGNVLVTKVALSSQDASDLFGYFLDLDIQTYSLGAEEYRASLDLAHKYKVTVYDASYLALALALDIQLVTADRKLATRASPLGIIQRI